MAEGICQAKTQPHREGSITVEEYTQAPSQAKGLTLAKQTSAGPDAWRSEGAGGSSTGFASLLTTEARRAPASRPSGPREDPKRVPDEGTED